MGLTTNYIYNGTKNTDLGGHKGFIMSSYSGDTCFIMEQSNAPIIMRSGPHMPVLGGALLTSQNDILDLVNYAVTLELGVIIAAEFPVTKRRSGQNMSYCSHEIPRFSIIPETRIRPESFTFKVQTMFSTYHFEKMIANASCGTYIPRISY